MDGSRTLSCRLMCGKCFVPDFARCQRTLSARDWVRACVEIVARLGVAAIGGYRKPRRRPCRMFGPVAQANLHRQGTCQVYGRRVTAHGRSGRRSSQPARSRPQPAFRCQGSRARRTLSVSMNGRCMDRAAEARTRSRSHCARNRDLQGVGRPYAVVIWPSALSRYSRVLACPLCPVQVKAARAPPSELGFTR